MTVDSSRFPIGLFNPPKDISQKDVDAWIETLALFPKEIMELSRKISDEDLNKTYREGSWTIRQVIHHLADSHTNSLIRFKWALTEDNPTIKAYREDLWAELPDSKFESTKLSILYLDLLHQRLVILLRALNKEQLKRTFIHPETGNTVVLDWNIGQYAWHSEHHLAHIKMALRS